MAVKQGDKDYLESHSKAKLEFLENYLDKYLKILILDKYTNEINIFDLFCGIGIYQEDNSKGSPVIIADLLKHNHHIYNSSTKLNLFINDKDKNKIDFVSNYIKANYNEFGFYYYSLNAIDIIKKIGKIKFKDTTKNFIFIDPHGYKDIYKKDIFNLLSIGKTEILLFLPVYHMYRFLKPTQEDKQNPSYKHIKRIMDEFELNYDVSNIDEYIERITQSLTFNGNFFVTNFKLKKDGSANTYALFFITQHIKGLEKAIEAKWKIDEVCGEKFEIEEKHLLSKLFAENKKKDCFNNFYNNLIEYLKEYKTNQELYIFALQQGFSISQANEALRKLQKENKLQFDRQIRKNSFYLSYGYYKYKEPKYKVKIK